MGARLDHVRSYYESLNTGDADAVAAHFTEDAVHYYTRREPHVGARAIADNAVLAVQHLNARWTLEHAVEGEDEVAIEWSMPSTIRATAGGCSIAAPSSWPSATG